MQGSLGGKFGCKKFNSMDFLSIVKISRWVQSCEGSYKMGDPIDSHQIKEFSWNSRVLLSVYPRLLQGCCLLTELAKSSERLVSSEEQKEVLTLPEEVEDVAVAVMVLSFWARLCGKVNSHAFRQSRTHKENFLTHDSELVAVVFVLSYGDANCLGLSVPTTRIMGACDV